MNLRLGLIILLTLCVSITNAAQYVAGDLAPRSVPDGQLNVADQVVLNRLVNGLETPTEIERVVADVWPLNAPDGLIDIRDLLILKRAVLGQITLDPIIILPAVPVLNKVASPTTLNPLPITGTAQPLTNIDVYVNDVLQQQTMSDVSGNINIKVNLLDGINNIQAVATDNDGSSPLSNSLAAQYNNTISRVQGGLITVDTVWTTGIIPQSYRITSDLTVSSGVTFFIQPGVILQFDSGASLIIDGELQVNGTELSSVGFTSSVLIPAVGDRWSGIKINATSMNSTINYALLENATTAIEVRTGSTNTMISNSLIRNNSSKGIYFNGAGGAATSNTITDNVLNGIKVLNASPQISNNTINNNDIGIELLISSSLINGNSITNNRQAGISIISAPSLEIITDNIITGNEGCGIKIAGFYLGVYSIPQPVINNNVIINRLCNILAGAFLSTENTVIDATGNRMGGDYLASSIVGSTDVNAMERKILDASDQHSINDNVISSYTPVINYSGFLDAPNGVPVHNDYLPPFIKSNLTLKTGKTYIAYSDVLVEPGATLIVEPGVTIRFVDHMMLVVEGGLQVNGISSNPVVFKSVQDSTSRSIWDGIRIESSANPVLINYAFIQNAQEGVRFESASGTVSNSIFTNNSIAINIRENANPVIDANTIVGNQIGVYLFGLNIDPQPTITNNDLYNNDANLLLAYIESTTILNTSNNWWGTNVLADIYNTINVNTASSLSSVQLDTIANQQNHASLPVSISLNQPYISPDRSIGIKDTVNFQVTFSDIVDWSVDVTNTLSQIVKTYSGSGTAVNIIWDGNKSTQAVADGRYTFVVTANGKTLPNVLSVVVDNTVPQAAIDSSLINASFTASPLTINGLAYDLNPSSYIVEVADSFTPLDADFRQIGASSIPRTVMSFLSSWSFGDMSGPLAASAGEKTLRLTVTDAAGNVSQSIVQITLNHLSITNVSKNVQVISPRNNDFLNISFDLSHPATVSVNFYPEQDLDNTNLVSEITQNFTTSGPKTISWDGMGTGNTFLRDEAYRFNIVAVTSMATVTYSSLELLTATGNLLALNYKFDALGDPISPGSIINYALNPINSVQNKFVKFSYQVDQPVRVVLDLSATTRLFNQVVDTGTHDFLWDNRIDNKLSVSGMLLPAGGPVLIPLRKDSVLVIGNNVKITGDLPGPDIEVVSTPYMALHSFDQISQVVYRIDQAAYVTVRLLNPCISTDTSCSIDHDDPEGVTLIDNQLLQPSDINGPIDHGFEWRGYDYKAAVVDSNNVLVEEEGAYTFSIKATSNATGVSTIYRGVIQLYH